MTNWGHHSRPCVKAVLVGNHELLCNIPNDSLKINYREVPKDKTAR